MIRFVMIQNIFFSSMFISNTGRNFPTFISFLYLASKLLLLSPMSWQHPFSSICSAMVETKYISIRIHSSISQLLLFFLVIIIFSYPRHKFFSQFFSVCWSCSLTFVVDCFSEFFKFLLDCSLMLSNNHADFFVKLLILIYVKSFGRLVFFFLCSTQY